MKKIKIRRKDIRIPRRTSIILESYEFETGGEIIGVAQNHNDPDSFTLLLKREIEE